MWLTILFIEDTKNLYLFGLLVTEFLLFVVGSYLAFWKIQKMLEAVWSLSNCLTSVIVWADL